MSNLKLPKEECLKAHENLCKALIKTDYVECIKGHTYQTMEDELGIFYQLINEHFELKEIIKKHGLENLTLHELDCAFKKMLGYVQENNRLMNLLTQQNEIIKEYQNGEAYKELKRSFDELLGHAVAFQEELINLKDNPPLKFEELHEKMWVWDNLLGMYVKIASCDTDVIVVDQHYRYFKSAFDENRFYRYEVKENE